jgi:anti-sigma factor (TIGR02949 family)
MNCEEARKSLDAYVDGELELSLQLGIEMHLEECASCQDAAGRISKCGAIVRTNMQTYKAPPDLKGKIRTALRNEDEPHFKWLAKRGRRLAYAALLLVLSCALAWSWFSRFPDKDKGLVAEAISNHSRSLMVSHLVDFASGDQHMVRPWFNGKLDYSPPVPDLTQTGYTLVGGRVDILEQRSVAAIVYQHGKQVINLFIWPAADRRIEMEVQSERGYHFCGWNKGRLNFFCISEISAAEVETFEDEVREHLNF